MATRNRRNEWHQVHGRWTRSLGERGMRVRIFEKRRNGTFYRTTWVPGRGRDHASLGTRDRNEAERLGQMLLAELLRQEGTTRSERLTLGALWKRYETECATYLDNKASTRRDDAARVKLLLAFFGEHCDVRTLTARDQSAYAASRKAGGIVLADGTKTRPVRTRSVEMDLVLLHTMLRWATTVRQPNGSRLLDANPLAGVRREREQNPTRPVASWERFQRTRAAMQALQEEATERHAADPESVIAEMEETRWAKMKLSLVLAKLRAGGSARSASCGGRISTPHAARSGGGPSSTRRGR